MADELMTIGRFAEISGLTVHALRHYDDIGLLAPAQVDGATGYRRYRRGQVQQARLIQALRGIDLPIEELRSILPEPTHDRAVEVLRHHRSRLEREQTTVAARLREVDAFIERGITMSPVTNARPVQIKLTVDDVDAGVAFYQQAFGFHYEVTRRTEDANYSGFIFSSYGDDDFFLLHLLAEDEDDRLGPSTFGLLVDDLEEAHRRAIESGGTEAQGPEDRAGMPRCSAVRDPSGNWIWLYQA